MPFEHAMFFRIFWVVAYARGHSGWFVLSQRNSLQMDMLISRQLLHERATVCSWVCFSLFLLNHIFNSKYFQLIVVVEEFTHSKIVSWCSASVRRKVNGVIENIFLFFQDILGGLGGQTKEEQ